MITRLVKMTFQEEKAEEFQGFVSTIINKISAFNGCYNVDILRDINNPAIFFSYSFWYSEDDLNNYRNSETFKEIWTLTKKMFAAKPEAWSTQKIISSKTG
ncbi:MAG: antibiotic biosynthesis monooxygenase [Bacteroidales bacterium]|nr:antibiotic biosynthesis monooxygenase [Bacteroidales bacterium]